MLELGKAGLLGQRTNLSRSSTTSTALAAPATHGAPTAVSNLTSLARPCPYPRPNENVLRTCKRAGAVMCNTCGPVASPQPLAMVTTNVCATRRLRTACSTYLHVTPTRHHTLYVFGSGLLCAPSQRVLSALRRHEEEDADHVQAQRTR